MRKFVGMFRMFVTQKGLNGFGFGKEIIYIFIAVPTVRQFKTVMMQCCTILLTYIKVGRRWM